MPKKIKFIGIIFFAIIFVSLLSAEDDATATIAPTYKLTGDLREYGKFFLQDPKNTDMLETRLKLELLSGLGKHFAFRTINYFYYDAVTRNQIWDFKEAYTGFYSTYFDMSLGKQIITWGKASDINPTDVVNPQDFSDFLEEKSVRKKGLFLLKTNIKLVNLGLEGIIKQEFDSARIPSPGSRWAFYSTQSGNALLPETEMPINSPSNFEEAIRISWAGSVIDASLCYFNGRDQQPTIRNSQSKFYRTQMFGGDISTSLCEAEVWAEAAYFHTADPDGKDMFIKNPYFQYILGGNYEIPWDVKLTLQYFQEIITKTHNNTEQKIEEAISSKLGIGYPLEQSLILNLDKSFGPNEKYRCQVAITYDIKENGVFFNPKFSDSFTDRVSCELGGAFFSGDETSFYNRFQNNNEAYLKLLYTF